MGEWDTSIGSCRSPVHRLCILTPQLSALFRRDEPCGRMCAVIICILGYPHIWIPRPQLVLTTSIKTWIIDRRSGRRIVRANMLLWARQKKCVYAVDCILTSNCASPKSCIMHNIASQLGGERGYSLFCADSRFSTHFEHFIHYLPDFCYF